MAAGIEIYNYVTNQKGSPALYSDVFANRPAAGFIGRLFISTDTLEIYRDNGTTWDLISGGGGPSVNIYNSNGTLTGARTMTMAGHNLVFEGGSATNRIRMSADAGQARIFSFASANVARWAFRVDGAETGSNAGADWSLRSYNDAGTFTFSPIAANRKTGEKTLFAQASITAGTEAVTSVFNIAGITYAAGLTMIGGNAHAAQFNNFTLANSGALTFANSSFVGASGNVLRLQANASGTVTMQPASPGLRAAAVSLNQIQYNTTTGSAITYTHAANIQGLGILQLFTAGSLTVTNAYGLLLNDLNEYGYPSTGAGALSIINRWGLYQDSTTDVNYLGGTTLVGTTINAGYKFDINGTLRAVNTVTFGSLSGTGTRMVVADASGVLSTQAIPGGGGISGSGTTNYVAKFTGASSIGNSQIFDNGTNVGIGTTSPISKLSVTGSIRTSNPSLAGGDSLFGIIDGVSNGYRIQADTSNNITYTWHTGTNAIALNIPNSGNILIGTTTDSGYKTDIYGILRTTQDAYFATTSGKVGIGTASPVYKTDIVQLDVNTYSNTDTLASGATLYLLNNAVTNNTASTIRLESKGADNTLSAATISSLWVASASSAITFGTRNAASNVVERLRIANTGYVGIGTTNPTEILNLSSTGATTVKIDATGATGNATINFTGPNNYPAIINYGTNMGGLLIQGSGTTLYNFATDGNFTIGNAGVPGFPTNTVTIKSGTAPSSSSVDTFTMYAADITAGNAAAHFRTENGGVIKLYQETTGVAAATFAANTGTAVNDASTFDGYTLNQIVKALRNLGILA
jgi:hypothetical protein